MSEMINTYNDEKQVISLWKEAFDDSEDDIRFFLENCRNKTCAAYTDNGKLYSMLFLVDCSINGEDFKYIYAASTFKSRRGMGDMTALLDYCRKEYKMLSLIAGDEELVSFYKKRGFTESAKIQDIYFDECNEIKEYLFEGSDLKKPYIMICRG